MLRASVPSADVWLLIPISSLTFLSFTSFTSAIITQSCILSNGVAIHIQICETMTQPPGLAICLDGCPELFISVICVEHTDMHIKDSRTSILSHGIQQCSAGSPPQKHTENDILVALKHS